MPLAEGEERDADSREGCYAGNVRPQPIPRSGVQALYCGLIGLHVPLVFGVAGRESPGTTGPVEATLVRQGITESAEDPLSRAASLRGTLGTLHCLLQIAPLLGQKRKHQCAMA